MLWIIGTTFWVILPFLWNIVCVCSWVFSACFQPVEFWGPLTYFHFVPYLSLSVQTCRFYWWNGLRTFVDLLWSLLGLTLLDKNHAHIFLGDKSFSTWASAETKERQCLLISQRPVERILSHTLKLLGDPVVWLTSTLRHHISKVLTSIWKITTSVSYLDHVFFWQFSGIGLCLETIS